MDEVREFLETETARLVIWISVLSMLLAVGWYLIGNVRRSIFERTNSDSDSFTSLRNLHDKGLLSDAEYRKIKLKIAGKSDKLAPNAPQVALGKGLPNDPPVPPLMVDPEDKSKMQEGEQGAD